VAANATTILHMTHNSQELGNALADVLFGDANPGGRLAQTLPRSLDDLPPMMDYDIRHGRTYMYFRGEPQFPFGYGLSYTTFRVRTAADECARARTGRIDRGCRGRDEHGDAGRRRSRAAVRPLSGLESGAPAQAAEGLPTVSLAPGEARTVTLRLAASDLALLDAGRHAWTVEAGRVEL